MTSVPPPQGLNEADYEAIEAAVTETVRGRWFLNEFARRNRAAELRQLLDAMSRLEGAVASGQAAVAPPADPSVRLLMQRIKEIAGQLDMLSLDMREAGIDERFASAVEQEARAVSGMMRGTVLPRSPARAKTPPPDAGLLAGPPRTEPAASAEALDAVPNPSAADDHRLALLSELDALPLRDKLVLFA